MKIKLAGTSAALLIISIFTLACSGSNPTSSTSRASAPPYDSPTTANAKPPVSTSDLLTEQDKMVYAKIKERVRKDHPDDYSTQKYVYERQVEAYQYMKTVPSSPLKSKIEKDHPYDFSTQKYVYENQIEAKEYMDSLPSSRLKDKVQKDHPNDYSTQKYVYERQIEAQEAMKEQ